MSVIFDEIHANASDLSCAMKFAFCAMGKSGGENVTFKVAGEQTRNDILANANTTSLTLDRD